MQAQKSQYRCLTCPLAFSAAKCPHDFIPVDPAKPAGLCGACVQRVSYVKQGGGALDLSDAGGANLRAAKRAAAAVGAFKSYWRTIELDFQAALHYCSIAGDAPGPPWELLTDTLRETQSP